MTRRALLRTRRFDVPCTIEIAQTGEHFHAHVVLDGNVPVDEGDSVTVHGEPVRIAFGQCQTLRRHATVTRASWLRRIATRIAALFELTELYEVSFTPRRTL